jgi:hypothetical protein
MIKGKLMDQNNADLMQETSVSGPKGGTQVVYINSFTNSGSTILGSLLGGHPQIQYIGESKNFQANILADKLCSCGLAFKVCPFWKQVLSDLGMDIDEFSTKVGARSRLHKLLQLLLLFDVSSDHVIFSLGRNPFDRERTMVSNVIRLHQLAAKVSGKPIICDSAHRSSLAKQLSLKYKHGSIKIIHLIRDGRGVMNSIVKKQKVGAAAAAKDWRNYTRYALLVQRTIPEAFTMQVKYEDLGSRFSDTLNRIYAFLNLELLAQQPLIERTNFHVIGGSRTLRSRSAWEFRFDETWRSELSPSNLDTFQKIAGRLNRSLGYER